VLLCRRHHRLVHEGGFGVHSGAGGRIWFTDPKGKMLPEAGETRFRGNVFALMTQNRRSGLDIGPRTGTCRWAGETMDDDLAVMGLLQREQ